MADVEPRLGLRSFSCPDCGAHSAQFWFHTLSASYSVGDGPRLFSDRDFASWSRPGQAAHRRQWESLGDRVLSEPFFHELVGQAGTRDVVGNLSISQCYSCQRLAIWIGERIVWPATKRQHTPSPDLSPDIVVDFLEADAICDLSPRGAAALLRLAIQKLVSGLTQEKDINRAIGKLVQEGLPTHVQKALDVVRVIGNNAVHPGQLDIKDDRATVSSLFKLVNLIVAHVISHQKEIDSLFEGLPEGAKAAIEKRDAKAGS